MATTIKLTNKFADNTTRELAIGTIDDDNPAVSRATLKANIFNINDNAENLNGLYFSTGGASFVEISAAEIIIESRNNIDLS